MNYSKLPDLNKLELWLTNCKDVHTTPLILKDGAFLMLSFEVIVLIRSDCAKKGM